MEKKLDKMKFSIYRQRNCDVHRTDGSSRMYKRVVSNNEKASKTILAYRFFFRHFPPLSKHPQNDFFNADINLKMSWQNISLPLQL
jgi:hypothetical protein